MFPNSRSARCKPSDRNAAEFAESMREAHRQTLQEISRQRRQEFMDARRHLSDTSNTGPVEVYSSNFPASPEKRIFYDVSEDELSSLLGLNEKTMPCPYCRAARGVTFAPDPNLPVRALICYNCELALPSPDAATLDEARARFETRFNDHGRNCPALPVVGLIRPMQEFSFCTLKLLCSACGYDGPAW